MADQPSQSKELLLTGLFAMAMGGMTMLAVSGMLPGKDSAHAPLWVGALAGGVFILAGGALVLRWFAGGTADDGELPQTAPLWMWFANYAVGLIVIGSLAAIGSWVAFGPGERSFSMSIPFLGSGPANQWLGRGVFGFGAILVWAFFFLAAVTWGRKLLRGEARVPK